MRPQLCPTCDGYGNVVAEDSAVTVGPLGLDVCPDCAGDGLR